MWLVKSLSKNDVEGKNNIPPSDATKELKDMEPLFLLLLRRFHVPAKYYPSKGSEPFEGFRTGRKGGMS